MVVKQTWTVAKKKKKIREITKDDITNSFKVKFNKTLNFKVNKINSLPKLQALKIEL